MSKKSLLIEEALYGVFEGPRKGQKDITDKISVEVNDGRLNARVTNELAGGDPVPNVVKELRVKYKFGGVVKSVKVKEGECISIPSFEDCMPENTERGFGSFEITDDGALKLIRTVVSSNLPSSPNLSFDSARLIHTYELSTQLDWRCRRFELCIGNDFGCEGRSPENLDIWEFEPENTASFFMPVPGTSRVDICHKCKGKKVCVQCNGSGHVNCDSCAGKGFSVCQKCDGVGSKLTTERINVTCPRCGGRGYIRYPRACIQCNGTGRHRVRQTEQCPACCGTGLDNFYFDDFKCDVCNGKGHLDAGEKQLVSQCHHCGGKGQIVCQKCAGNGYLECQECHGGGKCKECNGEGKATYILYCEQIALSLLPVKEALFDDDVDFNLRIPEKKSIAEKVAHAGCEKIVCDWESPRKECASESCPDDFNKLNLSTPEETATTKAETVLKRLWEVAWQKSDSAITGYRGGIYSNRFLRQRYSIRQLRSIIRVSFTDYGAKGIFYISADGKVLLKDTSDIDKAYQDLKRREEEEQRRNEKERIAHEKTKERLGKIFSYCSYFGLIAVAIALPYFFGGRSIAEYLAALALPELIIGVAAYFLSGFAYFYFYGYVWCLAERGRNGVWVVDRRSNKPMSRRMIRLLWLFTPLVLCRMLMDTVPNVAQCATQISNWLGAVSRQAWFYIAAISLIRHCINQSAWKWKWDYWVYILATRTLEVVAIVLTLWPMLLPEGTFLQELSAKMIGWLEAPLTFAGIAVVWPITLAWKVFSWAGDIVAHVLVQIISGITNIFK